MLAAQSNSNGESVSRLEAEAIAASAYIFGFPLVLSDAVHTAVAKPTNARCAAAASDGDGRSVLCLDLAREGFVLRLHDGGSVRIRDAWTDPIASCEARATPGGNRACALVGPRWDGRLPPALKSSCELIVAPTDLISVEVETPPCDLEPLARAGERSATTITIARWWLPAGVQQVSRMGAGTFLSRLARLMRLNPPATTDGPLLARLRRIGIAPGEPTRLACLPAELKPALVSGIAAARDALADRAYIADHPPERLRTDYLRRALWASRNLLGPPPRDQR
jgi:hypothetical protein